MNMNQEIAIYFPIEGVIIYCIVSHVKTGVYKIEESTVFAAVESATYGDIVSLFEQEDGTFLFQSVIKPSGLKRYCRILSKKIVDSSLFQALLVEVTTQGGYWEQAFGGVVDIYLPQNANIDVKVEIDHIGNAIR